LEDLLVIAKIILFPITAITTVIGLIAAIKKFQTYRTKKLLIENEYAERFVSQFNKSEINAALSGYVVPKCSPSDPTNREGEEYLADIQQSLFDYMDRNLENVQRSYHLLLADTGMGKTMFSLNYFAHCRSKFPKYHTCIVSLGGSKPDQIISRIINKSETILIVDAFDEDANAVGRGRERLSEILEISADFKMVIITCRSQYFLSDDVIPRETPLPILVPRQLGQSPTFSLVRSYISPFGPKDIQKYISKHFPLYYPWRIVARNRAKELVDRVPDLCHRPMLLERLPELAKSPSKSTEIYELYGLLVQGWIEREGKWIEPKNLRIISLELAVRIYTQYQSRHGRLTPDEIERIAEQRLGKNPSWKHLTARSLLNRDSKGNFKFAHKSILEFLVVLAAIEGDDRALEAEWTSFMKEVFISWGHSDEGKRQWSRARKILSSDAGRKSIAPLFDMLGTSAVRGIPNFKNICDRKETSTGERLAPPAWRKSSIITHNQSGRGIISISDLEYNLSWIYIPNRNDDDIVRSRLVDVLRFAQRTEEYRFPSFEQFIALAEGLHRADKNILPDGALFLLEDKPARHLHLLAQINSPPHDRSAWKVVEKERKVAGTNVTVNCYLTGAPYSHEYATNITVDQLYIQDYPTKLL